MTSNLELGELEQHILTHIKRHQRCTEQQIIQFWVTMAGNPIAEVRQALAQLVSLNFISADENLRYVAVGGKL